MNSMTTVSLPRAGLASQCFFIMLTEDYPSHHASWEAPFVSVVEIKPSSSLAHTSLPLLHTLPSLSFLPSLLYIYTLSFHSPPRPASTSSFNLSPPPTVSTMLSFFVALLAIGSVSAAPTPTSFSSSPVNLLTPGATPVYSPVRFFGHPRFFFPLRPKLTFFVLLHALFPGRDRVYSSRSIGRSLIWRGDCQRRFSARLGGSQEPASSSTNCSRRGQHYECIHGHRHSRCGTSSKVGSCCFCSCHLGACPGHRGAGHFGSRDDCSCRRQHCYPSSAKGGKLSRLFQHGPANSVPLQLWRDQHHRLALPQRRDRSEQCGRLYCRFADPRHSRLPHRQYSRDSPRWRGLPICGSGGLLLDLLLFGAAKCHYRRLPPGARPDQQLL